ncbi:MAG: ERCC4 domain-containing protein [Bacteroidales bacterium]
MNVTFAQLKTGDYKINNDLIIERKSADDFIQSIVSGRLFNQCAKLTKTCFLPYILLEGNPYQTSHQIDRRAVKGALISVITSWQIPVIHSENTEDSAATLSILSKQMLKQNDFLKKNGYKPRTIKNQKLKFLQGLPKVGLVMAVRLLDHFGSIQKIVEADEKTLMKVKGIGKNTAKKIYDFVITQEHHGRENTHHT